MVKIDGMKFGSIQVDGKTYRLRDVLIFPDGTTRRRKLSRWIGNHHKIEREDVRDLFESGVDTLIIGTGIAASAKVSAALRQHAQQAQVELLEFPSKAAGQKFNEYTALGKKVGALIHILC